MCADAGVVGSLYEGEWSIGDTTFKCVEADYNGDGQMDTSITVNGTDAMIILGCEPYELAGANLIGG